MRVSQMRMLVLLMIVVVGSPLAGGLVSAAQIEPTPATEESRTTQQPRVQQGLLGIAIGDAPDKNGYKGPVVSAATAAPASPSEQPVGLLLQNLLAAPGPDQQGSPSSVGDGLGWSASFYYFFAAGSVFRPRDSSTGWDYQGVGCISARGGSDLFTIHLEIPNGSRIDYLRILYYDTSASNSRGYITSYNAQGGSIDLIGVSSTGNAGYGYVVSDYLGHVVDNASNAYVLNWIPGTTGSTMRLCGLRVAYRLP